MGIIKTENNDNFFRDVIKRCAKGDRKAQAYLFKQYYPYVMSISLRFSSCRDNALDILNESFLKIFKHIQTYESGNGFNAWVHRIVVNTALDHYRREKKYKNEVFFTDISEEPCEESVLDRINAEDIILLINSLPMTYRYTFTLFEIEGFTHEEIAAHLDIAPSTSRSNLTRAKQMLRQMIKNRY